jgi:hypothetical protein
MKDRNLLTAALEGLELQKQRIEEQIQQVRGMLGVRRGRPPAAAKAPVEAAPKRELSVAARKRIALAQKRRWAAYRKTRTSGKSDT